MFEIDEASTLMLTYRPVRRTSASIVAVVLAVLLAAQANAETVTFACTGVWWSADGDSVDTDFSLRIDIAKKQLVSYSLWSTPNSPMPAQPVYGEEDGDSLLFTYTHPSAITVKHAIGLEGITGEFRHFWVNVQNGKIEGEPTLIAKGKCTRKAAMW